jgi:hypothetical protein
MRFAIRVKATRRLLYSSSKKGPLSDERPNIKHHSTGAARTIPNSYRTASPKSPTRPRAKPNAKTLNSGRRYPRVEPVSIWFEDGSIAKGILKLCIYTRAVRAMA